ncbi:WD40 repeat domain-containing protein [Camelimonas abortus]|uniref:WD40 repeat domain-containing protein n=1 Tax=Camelimonas abortus TaxID=1017184 RepID=A0ABV7LAA7_9HYPH
MSSASSASTSSAGGVSLLEHVHPVDAGAHVSGAAFAGEAAALALGDGCVLLLDAGGARRVEAHPGGAVLVAAGAGDRIITGGDDGRVVATLASGATELVSDEKGRWIDAVAASNGAVAWSCGKQVAARDARGNLRRIEAPSSVRGIAFAPKGYRVGLAHYNGATLWFPNTGAAPEQLHWKGSHLDATFSPDGRFFLTSMQENMLHGWRLADRKDLRMSGYPAKPRSISWSPDGLWMATSGADAAIIWPFEAKDGPMGKAPKECGVRPAKVTQVAFHPKAPVLAIGYDDGAVLLVRITDDSELMARMPGEGGPVTAMAWDAQGRRLVFGTRDGAAGLLTLP